MKKTFPNIEHVVYRETWEGFHILTRMIDNHELVFVVGGTGEITIDNKIYSVKTNDVIYFYPHQRHSLRSLNQPYLRFFGVHFSFPDDIEKLLLPDVFTLKNIMKITAALSDLVAAWNSNDYMSDWKQGILFSQILYTIFQLRHEDTTPTVDIKIAKVIDYIHENPYASHTIEHLCEVAKIKKSYLIDNFKKTTGFSPIQYCINLKLEHTKRLLINTDYQISQIARICGFDDEFYFSRAFKKYVGTSPSKFRE